MKKECCIVPEVIKAKEGLFRITVSAVIENSLGQILITRRTPQRGHRPGEWELVAGRINNGETDMAKTLKREVKEEVGIEVDVIAPFRTFYYQHGKDKQPHFGVNFYCSCANDQIIVLDEKEQDAFNWVDPSTAFGIIQDPNVKEAVLAYQRFRKHYVLNPIEWSTK